MRIAIGNWKMHTVLGEAIELANAVRAGLSGLGWTAGQGPCVGLAPPFVFLEAVGHAIAGTGIELVAQDCHAQPKGAFTGAVSAPMLASLGVQRVIVGHSERRQHFGEDDAAVRAKLEAVLAAGLQVVLCVGERLDERQAGRQEEVVRRQLDGALSGVPDAARPRVTVAYEPVWAIGTGQVATPAQAGAMHGFIRAHIGAAHPAVLYGGSVKPDNIDGLAATPGIDGALVGGASLDPQAFVAIAAGLRAAS